MTNSTLTPIIALFLFLALPPLEVPSPLPFAPFQEAYFFAIKMTVAKKAMANTIPIMGFGILRPISCSNQAIWESILCCFFSMTWRFSKIWKRMDGFCRSMCFG